MDNWDVDRTQFDQYSAEREEDKVINRLKENPTPRIVEAC
jgi:hypothetical protein